MSTKRIRKDSSDDYGCKETDESFDDDDNQVMSPNSGEASTGGRGRIRKKSAKVLEMEEVEELERAAHKGGKSKGTIAKKVKKPPEPSITSQFIKMASQAHQSQMENSPVKQKPSNTITECTRKSRSTKKDSPVRSMSTDEMESGNEDLTNELDLSIKVEDSDNIYDNPDDSKEDIFRPDVKPEVTDDVILPCANLLSPKKDTVAATIMALQAHLTAPAIDSQVDHDEPSKMMNKRIPSSSVLNVQPKVESSERFVCTAEEIDFMAESDEMDPDIERSLIIDTPQDRSENKFKSNNKFKLKKENNAPTLENVKQLLAEEQNAIESQDEEYYKDKDDDMIEYSDEDELSEDIESLYADSQEMGMRVMTSSEKLLSRKRKIKKPKKMGEGDPNEPKRKRPLTAYMLWANFYRHQLCQETPGMDFAAISRKLGEIWKNLPDKEKINWKKKAKRNANKSSNMISTGNTFSNQSSNPNSNSSRLSEMTAENEYTPSRSKTKSSEVIPIDCAAHLKLLGEALSIIGNRLQEHQGQIAVQGSLSVLLDSLLCALGPLICVMSEVPELDGSPPGVNASTLDNIAYFMPGIG